MINFENNLEGQSLKEFSDCPKQNIEQAANKLHNIEGSDYETWKELSVEKREYINELDIPASDWENLSQEEKAEIISDVKNRLEEIGIVDVEGQDRALRECHCSPELLGEFRKKMYNEKMSAIDNIECHQELTIAELKDECPQMYETVQRMNERLANDAPDGIMNTLHFYKTVNGDYVLVSDLPDYENTQMVISDGVVYAKTGCNIDNGPNGNKFNECLNTIKLLPNTTYVIDGRSVYEHDSQGRLMKETTVYTSEFSEKGERDTGSQKRLRDGKNGVEGDESSHSVPKCLGGSHESINQVPVKADINHGEGSEWRFNEDKVRTAVQDGKTVYVEHTYTYEGNSKRPVDIECETRIEDSKTNLKLSNRI